MIDRWTDRLSEYIDEELTSDERIGVDAHLAGCAECRRTLEELRRVVARAASVTPRPPVNDLWDGIASRIGRIAQPAPTAPRRTPRRVSFTLPQLVAASVALMIVSGGGVWVIQHGGRATSIPSLSATNGIDERAPRGTAAVMTEVEYNRAVADLEQTLQNGGPWPDPSTLATVQQNVALIDGAIEQARHALGEDPADIFLNNHLTDLKQQKLSLLRQVTAIRATAAQ